MIRKCLLSGLRSALVTLTCLGVIIIPLPTEEPIPLPSQAASQALNQKIKQIAKSISVKVLSNGFLGTGTLIKKQGKLYTVITNDHVLNSAEPPYQIQTPDGKIYAAQVSPLVKFGNYDLGFLQFSSNQVYQVPSMGDLSTLIVGDKVFVSGFTNLEANLIFTVGNVSLLLDKSLQGGYQMGYTNDISKGMSGGAVLNFQGQLIGINGLHKNPLWEAPDLYFDGSQPCKPLQEMITRSR